MTQPFEHGVYSFGMTPRTANGGYGPAAQAIRDVLRSRPRRRGVGLDTEVLPQIRKELDQR